MHRFSFIALFFLSICCNTADNRVAAPDLSLRTNSQAQILNSIVVHQTGGLEILKAFLSNPTGALINRKNLVRIGDTVCLNLLIKEGWIAENNTVSIGASQIITRENGEPVLSSPDLFAQKPGMSQANAAQLQLKTTLTKSETELQKFIVRYHVWDKTGPGDVKGYYRLQVSGEKGK